jgi:hypothetical protein
MVAAIEPSHDRGLDHDAQQEGGGQRQQGAQDEGIGPADQGPGDVGAHHVERAVRQVDEIHDPEHQRQSRRQQKQQQPELQSVQKLFDDEQHEHFVRK